MIGKEIYPGRVVELFVEQNKPIIERSTNRFRLLILESGSLVVNINQQQKLLEAPSFYCLNNRDDIHMQDQEGIQYRVIYFTPGIINSKFDFSTIQNQDYSNLTHTEYQDLNWLEPFINAKAERIPYIKAGPSSLRKMLHLCESMEAELDKQPDYFWPCRSRSFFLEMLYALHNCHSRYADINENLEWDDEQINKILVYLHNHYQSPITLKSLVEQFNMNRTKINDLFLKATGQPVISYLINLRVKLACLILRDTMRPVQEIAYQIGFNDISHFGRTFKKVTQYNPSEYREKYTWM